MKMYFVCGYEGPQWWKCYGVLSNGFSFGQHICSDPSFAPGDLYFTRADRISALKTIFNIDPVEMNNTAETIMVRKKKDVPEWWESLANNEEVQAALKPQYEEYLRMLGVESTDAKVEIEFTE